MADYKRATRVAGEIQAALARTLLEGLKDPRVTLVSITSISLSDDLRVANVRVTPLGGQGEIKSILAGLNAARGYLRQQLSKQVHLKYLPELRFFEDEDLDGAVRMTALLEQMESDRADADGEE